MVQYRLESRGLNPVRFEDHVKNLHLRASRCCKGVLIGVRVEGDTIKSLLWLQCGGWIVEGQ